ncbi:hypothetical protein MP638_004993 [Amoeboaphelidium occidentale]|nr:hypothetical protein MP638_004993 [Amoeboaphelidium occidentale]
MKFALSSVLFVIGCVIVAAAPQQSAPDIKKDDSHDVNESSPAKVTMVEKAIYSDKDCKDAIFRQFYEPDMVSCNYYSSGQCGSNGEIGSHMYTCPAQETELDMKEYARMDAYDTDDCSGPISTSIYFPRKNAGKCISYDTYGNYTQTQVFKLEGDKFSVGWSDCYNLNTYTKGKCVDKTIVQF